MTRISEDFGTLAYSTAELQQGNLLLKRRDNYAFFKIMQKFITPLTAIAIASSSFCAFSVAAEPSGFNATKLAMAGERLQQLIDKERIAGCVVLVARNGNVALHQARGLRDIKTGSQMEKDTIFRIYSMTKPITTTAVMMLIEEGKLSPADPVAKHLPSLGKLKVFDPSGNHKPAQTPMTVADLMRHTSGLSYGFIGGPVAQLYKAQRVLDRDSSLEDMVGKLSKIPLQEEPGSAWVYSVSIDVLGRLVEVISGKSFGRFIHERIFLPLGMKDTGFHVPSGKSGRLTSQHSRNSLGKLTVSEPSRLSPFQKKPAHESGGGGLCSTAHDYFRFCQMILNGGELDGKRLLKEETVALMTRNQLPESIPNIGIGDNRKGIGFGYGFGVRKTESDWGFGGRSGEIGWGGAASTHFWISPKDKLIVITLRNFMPYEWTLEKELKRIVYAALED
jgi:CubicO group peptidase (beta-lactamase class C family)